MPNGIAQAYKVLADLLQPIISGALPHIGTNARIVYIC